jgi:hypothetical protein
VWHGYKGVEGKKLSLSASISAALIAQPKFHDKDDCISISSSGEHASSGDEHGRESKGSDPEQNKVYFVSIYVFVL